jgi:tetratricopeptide (TPR) repeat protein
VHEGYAASQNGNDKEALENYSKAILMRPNAGWVYVRRAMIYDALGNHVEAIADYTKDLELAPEDRLADYDSRADDYLDLRNYPAAIADYTSAINLHQAPYDSCYIRRAAAYKKSGDYQKALSDYMEAIQISPSGGSYGSRSEFYARLLIRLKPSKREKLGGKGRRGQWRDRTPSASGLLRPDCVGGTR